MSSLPPANPARMPPAGGPPPPFLRAVQQAVALLQRGEEANAVAGLKRLLDQAVVPPQALGELAQKLYDIQALPLCRVVLDRWWAIEPRNPVPPLMIGSVCYRQRDYEQAASHYAHSAKRDARPLRAKALLAETLERLSRLDEAEQAALEALALDPNDPATNYALAQIEHRTGRSEQAADRLARALRHKSVKPRTEVSIRMTFGTVLDALGRYDDAFEQFEKANAVWLTLPQTQAVEHNGIFTRLAAYRAWLESAAAESSGDAPGRLSGWPAARPEGSRPAPVFFVAFPRSGTTLTEQMLGAHPKVHALDELPLLAGVSQYAASMGRTLPAGLDAIDEDQRATLERVYWQGAKQLGGFDPDGAQAGMTLLDKLPLNLVQLPLVRRIFPDARVIVALRDPRDCVLSAFMQEFAPNEAMVQTADLGSCARMYAEVMGLWLGYRDALGLATIQTHYEDLVADPEAAMRRLVEFMGLAWDPMVLEGGGRRVANTPSFRAVDKQVHARAKGRWVRYPRQSASIEPVLAPFIEAFGYEPAARPG